MLHQRRPARAERGAAALEFALVLPLLIVLVFGMVDCGWAINRYSVLNNAVREGVRTASLGGDVNDVKAAVQQSLDSRMVSAVTITVTCRKPDESACGAYDSDKETGGTAIVRAEATQSWLTPVMSTFSSSLQLSKTMQMRIE